MVIALVAFIVVLTLLVLVHEWGHFYFARRFGVKVDEFGFGFPPRIFGAKRRGILFSLNWIPLGGFVKLKGETGEHGEDPDSFSHKPIWQRITIIGAGVAMNLVLAAVLLSVGFAVGLPTALEDGSDRYARVRDRKVEVVEVLPASPAAAAGLTPGDAIVGLAGAREVGATSLRNYFNAHQGDEVRLTVRRASRESEVVVVPRFIEEAGRGGIGIALIETGIVSYPAPIALVRGVEATGLYSFEVVRAFGNIIGNLFQGQQVATDLSGPVGIAVITGKVARTGILHLLQFVALLSINLAVLNIIPFPALDGGRILFAVVEKVRGRPVRRALEQWTHAVGFALLFLLVLLVTYRDLVRYEGSIRAFFQRVL